MSSELVAYKDIEQMAAQVVKSRMFPGITTTESAITLMLLCQSEGLHPMQAMMRYHMIQGRPSMKADAMLSEFMRRGGTVKWIEWTNDACEAEFKSQGCPDGVKVRWTMDDAKRAGVTGNPTWSKYPRQMLKARVSSDGVRMADPAVNQGRYTPEEVQDFEPQRKAADYEVVGGESEEGVSVEGSPEPAAPAIQSATGQTTEEHLAEAKKKRDEALARYLPKDDAPPPGDSDEPFEAKLERLKAEQAAKAGRPKSVPDFCPECETAVMKFISSDGSTEYWECAKFNRERHIMKEQEVPQADIKEARRSHFYKFGGKVAAAKA